VRTYAPRGQTPVLRVRLSREHWSVIGGLTPAGKLYQMKLDRALRSEDVIVFLEHLLAQIDDKLLVIWDGAPIHRSQVLKNFLASEAGQRLQVEPLPGYAPELNPQEGVWNLLKFGELKNLCCANLQELAGALRRAVARLRQKPRLLLGCIRQVGYVL
jgi:transposase